MQKPFFLVLAIGAASVWWSSGLLPELVASHFGAGGAANGFMPRGQYMGFMLALVLAVPSLIFFAGRLASSVQVRFINLPNKQYWLAPERRAATLMSLGRRGVWAAYGTLATLCAGHWCIVRANVEHPPRLEQGPFIGILSLFLLALLTGMLVVVGRFFRVP